MLSKREAAALAALALAADRKTTAAILSLKT